MSKFEELGVSAPVLRSEDEKLYDKIHEHYMRHFKPADVVAWSLVIRLIHSSWLIMRYTRHQTVAVERWFETSLAYQAQRLRLQKSRREGLAENLVDSLSQNPADIAQLIETERKALEVDSDVADILNRTPSEIAHNRAMEKSIGFQQQLETLLSSTTKRFDETLELLDHYSEGLGRRLRQAAEQLFAAEAQKGADDKPELVEAPSAIPDPVQNSLADAKVDQHEEGDV
jgi:hypothetical protein